jgi:hypothetical protein
MNGLIFFGLAAAALSRVFVAGLSARAGGHTVALLLIALLGFRYASTRRLSRTWGIAAFIVGWFWLPIVGLVGLWALGVVWRGENRAKENEGASRPLVGGSVGETMLPNLTSGYGPQSFALLLAVAEEYEAKGIETEYGVSFASPHGEQIIPLLVQTDEGEKAIYVDANPWTTASEERFLRWLGLLRTSNREDVDVEIRSKEEVPERLRFYCDQGPRVLFEVAAVPQVKWVEDPSFGSENTALLRRLAIEYLDLEMADGITGLEVVDRLVVEVLRPDGHHLPWTVLLLGSFFGERLIAMYDGRWSIEGKRVDEVTVEVRSGERATQADVFGKVMKLFDNGMEDSTAAMARAMADVVG